MSEVSIPELNGTGDIVIQLRALIGERRAALRDLDETRAKIGTELRRFEKALASLTDEAPRKPGPKPATREIPAKVTDERLDLIRNAILTYCVDHEEFRQVDIRGRLDGTLAKSSTMALAFEQLRQEPDALIRFARKEGNNKYFRLTPSALKTLNGE